MSDSEISVSGPISGVDVSDFHAQAAKPIVLPEVASISSDFQGRLFQPESKQGTFASLVAFVDAHLDDARKKLKRPEFMEHILDFIHTSTNANLLLWKEVHEKKSETWKEEEHLLKIRYVSPKSRESVPKIEIFDQDIRRTCVQDSINNDHPLLVANAQLYPLHESHTAKIRLLQKPGIDATQLIIPVQGTRSAIEMLLEKDMPSHHWPGAVAFAGRIKDHSDEYVRRL